MIVVCPACSSRFQYGEARFQGARSKRFKCPKCAEVFEVANPDGTAGTPPLAVPTPAPSPGPAAPKPSTATSRRQRDPLLAQAPPGEAGSLPHGTRYSLAFLSGPQASTVRLLDSAVTVIGREEGDVIINDPEISRRHARIVIQTDGTAWLSDLGSTNGTITGGHLIDQPTQLEDRQEFSCGRSTFMLLIRPLDSMSMD
jgi:S-DNA-T family DNA segregation ATPase FtsK/SpoIIIE